MRGQKHNHAQRKKYLTKGEFFSLFVDEKNLSSNIHSNEDIRNCQDGSVEAEIIVEWGLLPEAMATEGLDEPVTKEIVVMVCANFAIGLSEGNIDEIKDNESLENSQLIADAYTSGFFELENGYFEGQREMSYADCMDMMAKESNYSANYHIDEDEVEIADDVLIVDADILFTQE